MLLCSTPGGGNQNAFLEADIENETGPVLLQSMVRAAQGLKLISIEAGGLVRFTHMILRDHFAFDRAMEVLRDVGESEEARDRAAWAIWQLPDARAVPVLLEATQDSRRYVRGSAIGALGRIGDRAAIPRLSELLKDGTLVDSIYGQTIGHVAARAIAMIDNRNGVG
jgi:hypothetical protein